MTSPREARRLCLTGTVHEAAAALERRGIGQSRLRSLLSAVAREPEPARTETVPLTDGWGRTTEMTVYVPETHGGHPLGVIVALHGVGGSGADLEPYFRPVADACGAVLLCPTAQRPVGRTGNFDLAGLFGSRFTEARWTPAPGDFPAQALRWAREHLAVDADRCALAGTSMGGITAWNLAARRWDELSLAASINGAPSIWELFGPDQSMRDLLPNLVNLPFVVVHGSMDQQIPPALDKEGVARLRALGHPDLSYLEVAGGEHRLSTMSWTPGSPHTDLVIRRLRSGRRRTWPARVRHQARECDGGRAHWVAIERITPGRTGWVDARVASRSHVEIRTAHAAYLRLFLSDRIVNPGRIRVTVNGVTRHVEFTPSTHAAIAGYRAAGADPGRMAQMAADIELSETSGEKVGDADSQ
ncbi:alpha/beta hydrolase [Nonomuraea sp. NPDC050540]|uniref:alpha/beta hydrolase n=1 Tax=Nonomuraea sp. NPDC050540 TaxID=3364367 RepID=UPI0037A0585D